MLEFGRGVPVRPQRDLNRPAISLERAGALAARILEARCLIDDQRVEQRMIVGNCCELGDEPAHVVDANHRELALGCISEQRAPAFRAAVENGHTQVPEVWPGRDLGRPYGLSDELGRDHQGVPAIPVPNQLGERRERGSALAGPEWRDQKSGIVLVQVRRGSLLI